MSHKLSQRQRELLDFVTNHVHQHGVAPTYREIGRALGIGSTNGVSDHIKALERKGYIERIGGRGSPRALKLTPRANDSFESEDAVLGVPVLGRIAAGTPLLAEENYEGTLRVDATMLPPGGGIFALIVTGESMIDDGIHHGDTLFVRQTQQVRNGEIAVVLVDGEATVKRVYREGTRLRLEPSNREMQPFHVDQSSGEVSIIGKAVGVFRKIR